MQKPILLADIRDYLATTDDFSFEMRVLRTLLIHGFDCRHGGHYEDPATKKSREFDIRAVRTSTVASNERTLRLAVECKNLRENFPLLVSCVKRNVGEDFHELLFGMGHVKEIEVADNSDLYQSYAPTVKSTTQVGRSYSDGSFSVGDGEVYEKWGQAVASAHDLVSEASDQISASAIPVFSTVVPVLVVPDGMLWSASYDRAGNLDGEPKLVDRATCFIGKRYPVHLGSPLQISHLEIVTFSGLTDLSGLLAGEALFPPKSLISGRNRLRASFPDLK